jgi:hypothetical protein
VDKYIQLCGARNPDSLVPNLNVWERIYPRRLYYRHCMCIDCTGLFPDESGPTKGFTPYFAPNTPAQVGVDLSAKALLQALHVYRLYRPLPG